MLVVSQNLCYICFTRYVADERNPMNYATKQILFGKYEILSTLGTGNFGTVYLSRHIILECNRAIKLIPKDSSEDSLLKEAQLLKSLNHPGIPTIYDIEQDDSYYYLVEEYVEGESLEEFLLHQKNISQNTFLDISLQLCDIFRYLHSFKPSPILYMDLKPEHIIVCGMQIKLIDFNVATYLSNLGNIYNLFGNREFGAPELFSGQMPNLFSDIYSIGKIMQYLFLHLETSHSPKLHKIIKKATDNNPACRYETVDELISVIKKQQNLLSQPYTRKKIAVIGSHKGCGTTHFAMMLTSTLNYMGYTSIYYEKEPKNSLSLSFQLLSFSKEKEGLIFYRYFRGFPFFGPGIYPPTIDADIIIDDYGDTFPLQNTNNYDLILYVCSNSIWHRYSIFKNGTSYLGLSDNFKIICNMGQKSDVYHIAKYFSRPVYHYPYDADPFFIDKTKISFVSKLLKIKRRSQLFFHLKNHLLPKP